MLILARDRAAQQIRFGNNCLDQFLMGRQFFSPASLFVRDMARVEEWPDFIIAKDGCDFSGGQCFFRIVAFNDFDLVFTGDLAQETPGVATGRSSALEPEIDCLHGDVQPYPGVRYLYLPGLFPGGTTPQVWF